MRSVERVPWATQRSSRHDDMCLEVVQGGYIILASLHRELRESNCTVTNVSAEAECGSGFCDVLVEFDRFSDPCALVVEVKTDNESASAGDTIRQLKWYRKQLIRNYNTVYLCVYAETLTRTFIDLCRNETIAVTDELILDGLRYAPWLPNSPMKTRLGWKRRGNP